MRLPMESGRLYVHRQSAARSEEILPTRGHPAASLAHPNPKASAVQETARRAAVLGDRLAEHFLLVVALAACSLFIWRAMAPAFQPRNVIQDDARQHVFWMARYLDPRLFPGDVVADYFQAVAPLGYSALYFGLSRLVDPLLASKLVPFALGLITASFTFRLVGRLHPSTAAAFVSTVLVSWYTWQQADLASGTPRAFHLPLLVFQLWAMASQRTVLASAAVVLAGLLYPSAGLLGVVLLTAWLVRPRGGRLVLIRQRSEWLAVSTAGVILLALLLIQQQGSVPYGPQVTVTEARKMKEFDEDGRSVFFVDKPYRFWILNPRSGFDLAVKDPITRIPILYVYLAIASAFPALLLLRRLPAVRQVRSESLLLLHVTAVSIGLFLLAHAVLFRLYLPSRYVKTSVPLVLAIAAGLVIGLLIESVATRLPGGRARLATTVCSLALGLGVVLYPAGGSSTFVADPNPRVTAYLLRQPSDVLVAGTTQDTDSLPAFARRSVLTSREFMNPYHLGFYLPLRDRTMALIDGYYARSQAEFTEFVNRYGVDFLVLNRSAYSRSTALDSWSKLFEPFSSRIESKFRSSERFWVRDAARSCEVVEDGSVTLVATSCLLRLQ